MSGRSRATAPRSRRCRASSSRCRARRCGNGWPPTCRRSICWRSRSMHVGDEVILVAAIGIDGRGEKHPLGLVEGATENAATVQALLDNLVARGLDPAGVWLFIIDGAKALDGRRHDGGQEGLPAAESLQAVTKVRDALLALRAAPADPALPISARPGHLLVPVYGSARRSQKEPPTSWSTVA